MVYQTGSIMAKFQITAPDGRKFEVTAPDGTSQSDVMAYFQKNLASPSQSKLAPARPSIQMENDPTEGMSTAEKVLAGVGKGMADIGRGVGTVVTDIAPSAAKYGFATRADVDEAKRLDAPLMDTGAGATGNVIGNIAAMVPAMMVPGANTIAGGAAIGGLAGALQPVGEADSRALNTGIGTLAGGAVPLAVRTGQVAKAALIDPFTNAGQDRIVGRALNSAAGNSADDAMRNMQQAAQPFVGPSMGPMRQIMGEIVPGSLPTAAQVADNAGIAALQRTASQTNPTVMNQFADRFTQQNAARVNALENIAGDDGMRAFYAADRDAVANQLYGDAFANASGTLSPYMKGQITQLLKRPSITEARKVAQKLAMERGEKPDPAGSLRALHDVKTALDDQIAKAVQENARGQVSALMATKEKLIDTMERMSPGYADARTTYAAMSKPLNQMDTAQLIADKSINPLSGNLQPSAFARMFNDATAAKASGFKGATLENTMEPNALNTLGAIKDDLAGQVFSQNAGRGVGSDTVQKLAYSNILDQSGLPAMVRGLAPTQALGRIAGQGANMLYSNANKELSTKLAEALMNPQSAAAAMAQAGVPPAAIAKYLMLGGQSGVTALPAVVNGMQQ